MKQEIVSFLSTCEDDIKNLCTYLYEQSEPSYKEYKSAEYICNLLEKYDFNITKHFLGIENAFIAKKGTGHPKICYLCEYDAIENEGHITGHNIVATISFAASIALGHVIDKLGGSVILIGCPGEYLGGTKGVMVKQNIFDDIDVAMIAHPDVTTCESGSSSAIVPLGIKFEGNHTLSFLNKKAYNPLDSALLTLNIINSIKKGFPDNLEVNYIISDGGNTPLFSPSESEIKFYIRASNIKTAQYGDEQIRKICRYVSELMDISVTFSLYEPSNMELITNHTLNRLFSHNLKEHGIIDIGSPKDIYAGLSIGDVSHKVPCIHPYISIVNDHSIKYGSLNFAKATISDFALNQCINTALSLASTAIDLIENENLLIEVKNEFYKTIK